jgi:hypothetical protein
MIESAWPPSDAVMDLREELQHVLLVVDDEDAREGHVLSSEGVRLLRRECEG